MTFEHNFVHTEPGWLHGETDSYGNHVYKGIPYALPPVGERRFKRPVPMIPWLGIREAVNYGAEAIQEYENDTVYSSEDCLYLNIWSPARTQEDTLPVLVWIHGGAFLGGSGSDPMYRGDVLARQGIIVVTLNYRLGVMGFLSHPEFDDCGNFGIMDQILALQWVKQNIHAFGGDPNHITVAGQSAGSRSIGLMLVSDQTVGLFQQAILQSGPLSNSMISTPPAEESQNWAVRFVDDCLDGKTELLYALPAAELNRRANLFAAAHTSGLLWRPCIDHFIIQDYPEKLFLSGKHLPVNLLAGCTSEEFISDYSPEELNSGISLSEFQNMIAPLHSAYPDLAAQFPYCSPKESLYQYSRFRAAVMLEQMKEMLKENANSGSLSYLYCFQKHTSASLDLYHAPHSAELPYLFGKPHKGGRFPWYDSTWKEEDFNMAAHVQFLWGNFVKGQVLKPESGSRWAPYTGNDSEIYYF